MKLDRFVPNELPSLSPPSKFETRKYSIKKNIKIEFGANLKKRRKSMAPPSLTSPLTGNVQRKLAQLD